MKQLWLLGGAMALIGSALPAGAVSVYSNDFEHGSTTGFTGAGSIVPAPSGQHFLGPLANGGTATLTLNTAGLTSVTLSYDLYAIMTVDGDGPFGGNSVANPDSFVVGVVGGPGLLNNSFANFAGDTQNYPVVGRPDQSGASAINTLGYGNSGDATYGFSQTFAVHGATTQISFTSNTNQGTGDEFYGLDNVRATGVAAIGGTVPEPASWAMMLAGFGLIGGVMRRRAGTVSVAA
ncbi:PEPxxWA-CTERM sorting domain-containing protein [Polymorphobacter megasporae]|uniref:PEPxxWA-CTERM sorting domain-containing protein n=1 Tax=Glacieibacterium megasporae TaxID=2835787 RepID=UPI0021046E37|nr:PEPxxWA-CTERM sorting domain-containing protein [Polymorphobacter megasporae]